jgi:predicted glycosyltransferase
VTQLAKLRKLNLKFVGKHGGVEKFDKLEASTNRINQISKIIQKLFKINPLMLQLVFAPLKRHVLLMD